MTVNEIMTELQSRGSESIKKVLLKHGVKEPFFGVKIEYLKPIQKKIKIDYHLAKDLYATGNADAMYLAGLIMKENDPEDKRSKIKKKYVTYFCPICFEPSHLKVHRNWLLKYLLFFLPVRKYFCDDCKKPFYVNIKTGKRSSHLH